MPAATFNPPKQTSAASFGLNVAVATDGGASGAPDLMDGSWLTSAEVQMNLGITRQRLQQLTVTGKMPFLMTPLGPLFNVDDVSARKDQVKGQKHKKLMPLQHCRGKYGPHEMTVDNVIVVGSAQTIRCRACHRLNVDAWRAKDPDRQREYMRRYYQMRKRMKTEPKP